MIERVIHQLGDQGILIPFGVTEVFLQVSQPAFLFIPGGIIGLIPV